LHRFVELAHKAIEVYLTTGQIIPRPNPLPVDMAQPAAVFVTIHLTSGELRGCRGTIVPTEPTLAEAIIKTAVASATDDPRFSPVTATELDQLEIKVDVLSPFEPVLDTRELDEKVYGVFIQAGERRALLLPDIAAVDSVSRQLELVRLKAGLGPHEPADLYRFTVKRHQ
jgi:AmmeMemoRadiSam system protein A